MTTLTRDTTSSNVIDPFSASKEYYLFKKWMELNEEDFEEYEKELDQYKVFSDYPPFILKSADKFIIMALELFKSEEIEKPATTFQQVMNYICTNATKPHEFVNIIKERLDDTMTNLALFNSELSPDKKKEVVTVLRDRGFM